VENSAYSPPKAVVADLGEIGARRSAWAKLILTYYALALFGTFGSILVLALKVPNNIFHPLPRAARVFGKFGLPWFTLMILTGLSIAGAFLQLIRRKKSAAYFASAGLVFIVINWVWVFDNFMHGGDHHTIQNSVGLAINVCIVVYLWRLVRSGELM
jgi:uncharacterized membrane protein (DUF2068 family)